MDDLLMRQVLLEYVNKYGSQKEAAKHLGITDQYLCDILKGRRELSSNIADRLGYKKTVIYIRKRAKK